MNTVVSWQHFRLTLPRQNYLLTFWPKKSSLDMVYLLEFMQTLEVSSSTFLDSCSISLTHSSKYNARGNGRNERYNGELQRVMTRILGENGLKPDDWELVVGESLFILRSRICKATGKSPHDMFFSFQRRIFANSKDLDSLEAPQIVKNKDLKRGSHVLIRNFVRHRKTDPFVEERGVVTDILSPQSAEVTVDGRSLR